MELMTTATNKRKIRHDIGQDHQEEEDDDQKIDKFFALIKNLREARDRLMSGSKAFNGTDHDQNKRVKRKVGEEKPAAVWKPSFQREDFMPPEEAAAAAPFKNPPPVTALLVGSSSQRGGGNKENDTEGLDLRLSL